MALQIFFQVQILGMDDFLVAGSTLAAGAAELRAASEELPLRFLSENGLSPMLLGTATLGQFMLVLPEESKDSAVAFFTAAAAELAPKGLRLIWAATENLGTWKLIRTRLDADLEQRAGAPGAPSFEAYAAAEPAAPAEPIAPGRAVLRGDVDNFSRFLSGAESIETHIERSLMFKSFFEGELARLPAERASVIYSSGSGFALSGNFGDLIEIAVETRRIFELFVTENLKESPGPEGKTLSMALALPEAGDSEAQVYTRAGVLLDEAKTLMRDGFHLLGRTIEWKQVPEASAIKDLAVRLVKEFKCSTQFIGELLSFYPEGQTGRRGVAKYDRPWRFHRRLAVTLDPSERRARSKDFVKTRTDLAGEIIGKNVGQARLRPTGRVALEWAARLAAPAGSPAQAG
ncbi:MAG: hypothetical protein NTZ56_12940 [Acidobacteria bacterium]|nr:hypothetical protein [Acidobacteriota bacterium]